MCVVKQVEDEFRPFSTPRDRSSLYLKPEIALKCIERCEELDVAVIGLDAFILEGRRLKPRTDIMADWSIWRPESWTEFRSGCNRMSADVLERIPHEEGLVYELCIISRIEWRRGPVWSLTTIHEALDEFVKCGTRDHIYSFSTRPDDALECIERCERVNLAVTEVIGMEAEGNVSSQIPGLRYVWSNLSDQPWEIFRSECNRRSIEVITNTPKTERLVFNLEIVSEEDWKWEKVKA